MDWTTANLDQKFFLESGLLFEINRQYLHPFGISMTVVVNPDGSYSWSFKDCRKAPNSVKFDAETLKKGVAKFKKFLAEFGYKQMEKRIKEMGQSVQAAPNK